MHSFLFGLKILAVYKDSFTKKEKKDKFVTKKKKKSGTSLYPQMDKII